MLFQKSDVSSTLELLKRCSTYYHSGELTQDCLNNPRHSLYIRTVSSYGLLLCQTGWQAVWVDEYAPYTQLLLRLDWQTSFMDGFSEKCDCEILKVGQESQFLSLMHWFQKSNFWKKNHWISSEVIEVKRCTFRVFFSRLKFWN